MIKLLRNIRRNLLIEGKTTKYFKYAIGEIILVVIGILIALSINNWNTQRIAEENAVRLSVRLLAETERNIDNVNAEIDQTIIAKNSGLRLLHLMTADYTKLDEREVDSLVFRIYFIPILNFNSAVLSEAFSTGEISNFRNDSLKNLVYSIPTQIEYIRQIEESLDDAANYLDDFLYDNYSLRKMDYRFSSNGKLLGKSNLAEFDNRKIMLNQRFENILDEQHYSINHLLKFYEEFNTNLEKLTKMLEEQMDSERE